MDTNPAQMRRWSMAMSVATKGGVFLGLALLLTESFWRIGGFPPVGSDLKRFARLYRGALGDPRAVALIGSSRVQLGLNPAVLQLDVPDHRFFQLAIEGTSGLPLLERFANNPSFQGSIICEFNPVHWLEKEPGPNYVRYLEYMHPKASGDYLETLLAEEMREHFSFFTYNLLQYGPRLLRRRLPGPSRSDRFDEYIIRGKEQQLMEAWESGVKVSQARISRAGPSSMPEHALTWVRQIRDRGGDVAFVRMPVDGPLRTIEEAAFPQAPSLMNQLRSSGTILVDFADIREHFWCPDGSHLEYKGAARFSSVVSDFLKKEGFFAQKQNSEAKHRGVAVR
jgi:hypothetical protein